MPESSFCGRSVAGLAIGWTAPALAAPSPAESATTTTTKAALLPVGATSTSSTSIPTEAVTGLTGATSTSSTSVSPTSTTTKTAPAPVAGTAALAPAGTTHYRIDMKAWIPQPRVVDPEQPIPVPYPIAFLSRGACFTPSPFLIPFTMVTNAYRGDDHDGFDGSYRVMTGVEFDWDGSVISNVTKPSGPNYGQTVLRATYRNFLNTNTCDLATGIATESVTADAGGSLGPSSFRITYSATDPLVRIPAPAIDGETTGTVSADGTVDFHFRTDTFPSHGVRVSKNSAPQLSDIVTDASCIPDSLVVGPQGIPILAVGLTTQTSQGDRTVFPNDADRTGARNSPLCLGL